MNTDRQGIYDARQLGKPKFVVLGIQHLFAMFGATILVPLITGLDVSATLLFAGIGTLIFHLVSKMKVPAFLGSSFAFLGGYASVKQLCVAQGLTDEMALNYACLGIAAASLLYFVMAFLLKMFGTDKVMRFFPPVVTGPMVIAIGLTLSGSAISNCQQKLAPRHHSHSHRHRLFHLGTWHHKDCSHLAWRARLLRLGGSHGRGRLLKAW